MFFNALTQVGSHTHIVASIGAFQDIAGSALRLAHQGFGRSGHSAQGGMAERVGFELEPGCAREHAGEIPRERSGSRDTKHGGEGGIRTHEPSFARLPAFEAGSFNRSDTSPQLKPF